MSNRRFAWIIVSLCGVGGLVVGLLIGRVVAALMPL